jgi:hypothetical protein
MNFLGLNVILLLLRIEGRFEFFRVECDFVALKD